MSDVTLTAAMRANLLSLQQTAKLMGTTQNRLATGKAVNSALDGPINYFAAQSLTNRANDIAGLLDGMGQAIQTIKAASEGIDAAKKVVDQMKSVANTAAQNASDTDASTTEIETKGTVDATRQLPTAASSSVATSDDRTLLTNLNNYSTGAKLDIRVGDAFTIIHSGADDTTVLNFSVAGDSTLQDLQEAIDDLEFTNAAGTGQLDLTAAVTSSGYLAITMASGEGVATNDDLTLGGAVGIALGINGTLDVASASAASTSTGSIVIGSGASYLEDKDAVHRLAALTDVDGDQIGLAYGDTFTMQYGDNGEVATFTIGFSDTIDDTAAAAAGLGDEDGYGQTFGDLDTWIDAQTSVTGSITSTGQLKIETAGTSDQGYTLGGTLVTKLGISTTVAANGGTSTGTVKMYVADQSDTPTAEATTLVRDLSRANGEVIRSLAHTTDVTAGGSAADLAPGETITVQTTTGTDTIRIGNNWTVQSILDAVTAVDSGLALTLNGTGQFVVDNQTAGTVTFSGTVGKALFNNTDPSAVQAFAVNVTGSEHTSQVVMYAAFGTKDGGATSGVPSDTYIAQFDTLHTQLDKLVEDASYQGTNLIGGTSNSPLNVVFNEAATDANKLAISAVDMTTAGLGISVAEGTWTDTDAVETAISSLTAALTTLRDQSSTFGQNLTLVQTRQDFANNIISTLREGADKLTLADMNEEGANMLALQTRSQLGTQSLALASQANASVLRLFG